MIDIISENDIEDILYVDIGKLNALIERKLKEGDFKADFTVKIKSKTLFTRYKKKEKVSLLEKMFCTMNLHNYKEYYYKGKHGKIHSKRRCVNCGQAEKFLKLN